MTAVSTLHSPPAKSCGRTSLSAGGRSTVRKALGLNLEGEAIDEKPMLVADVEVEGLDRLDWHIWPLARSSPIGLCPLPGTALFQLTAKSEKIGPDIESAVHRATRHRIVRVSWSSIYRPAVRMVKSLPRRTRVPGGGCGSCTPSDRWTRSQHGRSGRLQSGLETRARSARCSQFATRHIRSRAPPH